jgi:hypothetical protein
MNSCAAADRPLKTETTTMRQILQVSVCRQRWVEGELSASCAASTSTVTSAGGDGIVDIGFR